jgi:hypothetical protein
MEKKKFMDVVKTIKPGETWYGRTLGITKPFHSELIIFELTEERKERNFQDKSVVIFLEEEQFELKCRKYFNTQMATLAYMEGKTIQSLVSGKRYSREDDEFEGKVTFEEVNGVWYIE